MSEPFDWGKFWRGILDPTAYWKDLAGYLRLGLVVIIGIAFVFGVIKMKQIFFPKPLQPNVVNITGQQGGEVTNSKDDSKHWTLLKFLTFDRK